MGGVEFIDAVPKNPSGKIVGFYVAASGLLASVLTEFAPSF